MNFPQLPFPVSIPYYQIKDNKSVNMVQTGNETKKSLSFLPDQKRNYYPISIIYLNHFKKSSPKCSVKMNEKAKLFKIAFYQMFTIRKKFPKKYVIMIHNDIHFDINLRCVNRDEARSINLYFVHFAKHSEKILSFIQSNKHRIIENIPDLRNILDLFI